MLKTKKGYRLDFYTNYSCYYLKNNKMKVFGLDCRDGGTEDFSNAEEALKFLDNYLQEKHSTFIVFENVDNLDMYGYFNMDLIGLTETIKGKVILLEKESMQLILSDKSWINIPDLPYILLKELEKNFRSILIREKEFPFDKKENVKFLIGR